jgi:hypothetical protein
MAVKKSVKKSARKSSPKTAKVNAQKRVRIVFEDGQKIKVVGEHNRREGSRYFGGYESLKKSPTIAAFRKRQPDDAQELLRAALKDGYIKVA